jgi:hypothetical protein
MMADVKGYDGGKTGLRGILDVCQGDGRGRRAAKVEGGEDEVQSAGSGAEYEGSGLGALVKLRFGLAQQQAKDEGQGEQQAEGANQESCLDGVLPQVACGEVDGWAEGIHLD